MTEIKANRRVNVRGIIYRDGKILGVCQKDDQGNPNDYYAVPGGGLDPFEPVTVGAERELMEELGVQAKIGKLLFMQQYRTRRVGYDEELELFFAIDNPEDFVEIDLASTSHGDAEIAHFAWVDPRTEKILPKFLQTIDIADYIENGKPVYIANNFGE